MDANKTFTTSQLADAAAVGPQTLRYYERRGLLPEPPRTPGGHRIYGPAHLTRLRFIQVAQGLGFDLQEIHGMLELCPTRRSQDELGRAVDALLATVDGKIGALTELRGALKAVGDGGQTPPGAPTFADLVGGSG